MSPLGWLDSQIRRFARMRVTPRMALSHKQMRRIAKRGTGPRSHKIPTRHRSAPPDDNKFRCSHKSRLSAHSQENTTKPQGPFDSRKSKKRKTRPEAPNKALHDAKSKIVWGCLHHSGARQKSFKESLVKLYVQPSADGHSHGSMLMDPRPPSREGRHSTDNSPPKQPTPKQA
jgi:hypothetical protein